MENIHVACYGCGRVVPSVAVTANAQRFAAPARCEECAEANRGTVPAIAREISAEAVERMQREQQTPDAPQTETVAA